MTYIYIHNRYIRIYVQAQNAQVTDSLINAQPNYYES